MLQKAYIWLNGIKTKNFVKELELLCWWPAIRAIPSWLCLSFILQQDDDPKHTSKSSAGEGLQSYRQAACIPELRMCVVCLLLKAVDRIAVVCEAVIKANGGYFGDF